MGAGQPEDALRRLSLYAALFSAPSRHAGGVGYFALQRHGIITNYGLGKIHACYGGNEWTRF